MFKKAPQTYHLLIIFMTILRMPSKFFEFLFSHWGIMKWKVFIVGSHQLGERNWLVNLRKKWGGFIWRLWRSPHKHTKLKKLGRTETKAAWYIYVAGSGKNYLSRVALSVCSMAHFWPGEGRIPWLIVSSKGRMDAPTKENGSAGTGNRAWTFTTAPGVPSCMQDLF